jgi:hypothetical protein
MAEDDRSGSLYRLPENCSSSAAAARHLLERRPHQLGAGTNEDEAWLIVPDMLPIFLNPALPAHLRGDSLARRRDVDPVLALRATRGRNAAGLQQIFSDLNWAAERHYIPSALAVLIFGILLTIEGPWSFSDLWIILGLVGYAFTFGTGLFVIKPAAKRIAAMIERHGGVSPSVANMALKPSVDDVGTLVAMAAVVVGVSAYSFYRSRSPTSERATRPALEK